MSVIYFFILSFLYVTAQQLKQNRAVAMQRKKKSPDSAAILLSMISIYTNLILTFKYSHAEMSDLKSTECPQFELDTLESIKIC